MENKNPRYGYHHTSYDVRIFYDVPKSIVYTLHDSGRCMVVPHSLFFFRSEKLYRQGGHGKIKNILNILLLIAFILTILVPITGVHVHKLASLLFLVLCLKHTIVYWKKIDVRRFCVLGLILATFLTGLFSMIFDEYAIILSLHKVISVAIVFLLAIHIFVFHKNLYVQRRKNRVIDNC